MAKMNFVRRDLISRRFTRDSDPYALMAKIKFVRRHLISRDFKSDFSFESLTHGLTVKKSSLFGVT